MAGLLIALSALALQASGGTKVASPAPQSLPTPQEVKKAVLACGLPSRRVSVAFERSMEEDVVWIARASRRLSSSTLDCMAAASVKTSYYVYFRDLREQKAFDRRY